MPSDLGPLRAQVERIKTVKGSVRAAFLGLAAKIEENKNNPVEIQSLADELRMEADEITADVAANTPAATEPPPPPGEVPPGEVPPGGEPTPQPNMRRG